MKDNKTHLIMRPRTRGTVVKGRITYNLLFSRHGVSTRVALAWIGVVCAVFCVSETKATPVDWTSMSQIVPWYSEEDNVRYTTAVTLNGQASNRNTALVFYKYFSQNGGYYYAVGGFDVVAGATQANGWILRDTGYGDGLTTGESLNTGSAPDGYWDVVYDYNNNGRFGKIDDVTGVPFSYEPQESISNMGGFSINVSGLPAFPPDNTSQSGGLIEIHSGVVVPEPSTSALAALGVTALGGGTNQLTLSVAVSNAVTFSVTYKNSLTNATWENLGSYSKTGAVTVITDTNSVPQRFYRVVAP